MIGQHDPSNSVFAKALDVRKFTCGLSSVPVTTSDIGANNQHAVQPMLNTIVTRDDLAVVEQFSSIQIDRIRRFVHVVQRSGGSSVDLRVGVIFVPEDLKFAPQHATIEVPDAILQPAIAVVDDSPIKLQFKIAELLGRDNLSSLRPISAQVNRSVDNFPAFRNRLAIERLPAVKCCAVEE